MAQGEVPFVAVGNLTSDPELRFTHSGTAVASFTVVTSKRVKNGDQWEDGPPSFWRCSAWRQMAENCTELRKGDRVFVQGAIAQRTYETAEGDKRTVFEVQVEDMGPSIKWKAALPQRVERSRQEPVNEDPWASPPPPRPSGGFSDEPPF